MKTTPKQNLLATALTLTLLGAVAPAQAAEKKPNVVHIVADDLGWKDVGFNGCTDVRAPNIDALAKGGAKFTQFYVQPMCTPTRAALMTGRYPFRYGLQTIVIPGPAGYGLDTSEYLMPQCLKDAGYTTAIIGKWHLGHADEKYWPKQRGFDYQYGAMIGELDYYTHSETMAEGKPSPRTEVVYNVEPFRGGVRQGDWKLIWRTLIPTSADLYNLAEDPYEKNNVATAHPDRVTAMQERLNALGRESAKPLALMYIGSVGLAHGKPRMGSENGKGAVMVQDDGHSITDEGIGDSDDHP